MVETPLSILLREFLPEEQAAGVEAEVASIRELPPVKALSELKTPQYGNDPTELIKHRFLYRGGVLLLLGPTGIGKSAFVMQLGIHFAIGRSLFGIEPGDLYQENGMRILLVQAENDEGDLAEMRDGVLAGCTDLTDAERTMAQKRFTACTINDRSSDRFTEALEALLKQHGPFDIVIVDPAFAYLGGDSNSQRDVSFFMRELLNPLLQTYGVGMILAHHTNKPPSGKEKNTWQAGDYAYLGAGSAEWINPARAALAIRSLGSDSVFELRAPKRGKRLRWLDEDGQPTVRCHIAHHDDPGVICWREATPEEIADVSKGGKGGRPRKCEVTETLHCIKAYERENQRFYAAKLTAMLGCSKTCVQDSLALAVGEGLVRCLRRGRENRYMLTQRGRKKTEEQPSAHDWSKQ